MATPSLAPRRTYLAAALTAFVASLVWIALGHNPLITEPALAAGSGRALVALSVVLGIFVAVISIVVTRRLLVRVDWARELARTLRPRLTGASTSELVRTAVVVGVTEEIFFRGILQTVLGVWLAAAAFGLVHAGKGRTRAFYAAWAALTGAAFGVILWLTGSIAGPVVAHVVINAANALYLRDLGAEPRRRRALGGLLSR